MDYSFREIANYNEPCYSLHVLFHSTVSTFPLLLICSCKDYRSVTSSNLATLFHTNSIMVNIWYIVCDSHNHHAKCIIHKLFSATFCTVALIIIITEAQ